MSLLSEWTGINIDLMPAVQGVKVGVTETVARAAVAVAQPSPTQTTQSSAGGSAQAQFIAGISNTALILAGLGVLGVIVVVSSVGRK